MIAPGSGRALSVVNATGELANANAVKQVASGSVSNTIQAASNTFVVDPRKINPMALQYNSMPAKDNTSAAKPLYLSLCDRY